ncbi:hypothetical protein BaRGS_00031227, partial [Batillaria attramentaria]
ISATSRKRPGRDEIRGHCPLEGTSSHAGTYFPCRHIFLSPVRGITSLHYGSLVMLRWSVYSGTARESACLPVEYRHSATLFSVVSLMLK